ncbi:DNA mismatch repair endonuclease MutL [Pseudidiomarina taiwanensis]|uniref:DNA mismatch repair protein MutL n=1 Tax=Pseudidiomarina taiwanensis TaxID=337250 RepID=A0A432ZKR3_9GAMM|nr:DNA mismatch repair endonuclease MutL [Pseudidiomarina taiwanensis]RUO78617.1 DNA mismatch repair protein MutL [Pseudidiomarina taiwanensis]
MPIRQLPIELANQIAAGEVIERPASVAKELLENSLDAGATKLHIDIEQGGRRRILVRDNGAGIPKDELALALSRHATSKISSLADLEAIMSLGFRGEALASISSVARLLLTSKTAEQQAAWQAWVEGRDMQPKLAPASHPTGTSVDVQDLFFNTPARRKFLRTDKTEFGHIDELIRRLALVHHQVEWRLTHNGKSIRHYPPASAPQQRQQRLAKICGQVFAERALEVDHGIADLRLQGWIAPAAECRYQGDVQYMYVNGRMMRDRLLQHAVRQAYGEQLQQLGESERVPTYVLYLELPANEVDVNVHPAKHEVRFHQARHVHDFVLAALREVLQQQAPAAMTTHQYQPSSAELAAQVAQLKPVHGSPLPGAQARPTQSQVEAQRQFYQAPRATQSDPTSEISALAVAQQRFALLQHQQQFWLLDLQRVQRDVVAQQLAQQYQTGLAGQPLLVPVQLKDPELIAALRALPQQQLAQLGFMFEIKRQAITFSQVPAPLRQTALPQSLPPLLQMLTEHQDESELPEHFWRALASHQVAQSYPLQAAQYWLEQWQQQLGASADFLLPLQLPELPEPLR